MHNVAENLIRVKQAIRAAEGKYGREPGSVRLIAVSKTRSLREITLAFREKQLEFGESYVQEAVGKMMSLDLDGLCWHFIGPVQSNKTRGIAENFSWIHSVDRLKIAQRLNDQRPDDLPPLNICIQINLSGETSKSGMAKEQLETLAEQITQLPKLRLRGLMVMPAMTEGFEQQCRSFRELKHCFDDLNVKGYEMDNLSMGTSHDMEAAIAEGATMVRIGTAIFGPRDTRESD